LVLHDAAPDGIVPLPVSARRPELSRIVNQCLEDWAATCAYFGHLYPGRGIDLIEAMAAARPKILFLVFGGNESDIQTRRQQCKLMNLHYGGHLPHRVAQQVMRCADVLLMPYQANVSIGLTGHDTARWMSPMKMFEYLAAGVPIISSDLPVLREVLRNGENCLLANPSHCDSWLDALDRLTTDHTLAEAIGRQGHADYVRRYTWTHRAKRIIQAAIDA
jgi:glycosyltransferase involved in cell wall biosynthesis